MSNEEKTKPLQQPLVMPSSCIFKGQRRAIKKTTKHFYFFAEGDRFKYNFAEKQLCSDVR